MAITGEEGRPPVRVGIPLADLSGGIFACKGILAALFSRERTGEGRRVELSMYDSMLNLLSYMGTMWLTNGELPTRPGSSHDYTVPWQAFETKDGHVVVATRQEILLAAPVRSDRARRARGRTAVQHERVARPEPRRARAEARSDLPRPNSGRMDRAHCAKPTCRRRPSTISTALSQSRQSPNAR